MFTVSGLCACTLIVGPPVDQSERNQLKVFTSSELLSRGLQPQYFYVKNVEHDKLVASGDSDLFISNLAGLGKKLSLDDDAVVSEPNKSQKALADSLWSWLSQTTIAVDSHHPKTMVAGRLTSQLLM